MLGKNENFLKTAREANSQFVFRYLFPFLLLVFLIASPAAVAVSTLVLSPFLYWIFNKELKFNRSLFRFSVIVFLIVSLLYSCLPKVQLESFKLFHPDYTQTEGKITDYEISWTPTAKTSAASAVASVKYTYRLDGNLKHVHQMGAISLYSANFFNTESDKQTFKLELDERMKEYIQTHNYEILADPEGQSKLFIPVDYFSFKTSFLFRFLLIILKSAIILLFLICLPNIIRIVKGVD